MCDDLVGVLERAEVADAVRAEVAEFLLGAERGW